MQGVRKGREKARLVRERGEKRKKNVYRRRKATAEWSNEGLGAEKRARQKRAGTVRRGNNNFRRGALLLMPRQLPRDILSKTILQEAESWEPTTG